MCRYAIAFWQKRFLSGLCILSAVPLNVRAGLIVFEGVQNSAHASASADGFEGSDHPPDSQNTGPNASATVQAMVVGATGYGADASSYSVGNNAVSVHGQSSARASVARASPDSPPEGISASGLGDGGLSLDLKLTSKSIFHISGSLQYDPNLYPPPGFELVTVNFDYSRGNQNGQPKDIVFEDYVTMLPGELVLRTDESECRSIITSPA